MAHRVGFASVSGEEIDEHFGSARYWQIYDISDDAEFLETRKTKARCNGHCEGGFDEIIQVLDDCDALFVLKIGESAAAYMISKGKRVFEAAGSIEEIAAELSGGDYLD